MSPIDLIPDFIPIIGYLDDLIIIPAGIFIAIRMIPKNIFEECRQKAIQEQEPDFPKINRIAAAIIIMIWLVLLVWILTKILL